MGLLIAFLILNFVIIVHEFGHFVAARLAHIHVSTFSLGMGPKLLSIGYIRIPGAERTYGLFIVIGNVRAHARQYVYIHHADSAIVQRICQTLVSLVGFTVWELRLIPVGGFIEPAFSKAYPRRLAESLVLFGGPAANFALFLVGSTAIFFFLRDLSVVDACLRSFHMMTEVTGKIIVDIGETVLGKKEPEFQGPVGIVVSVREQVDQSQGLLRGFGFMLLLSLSLGVFNLIPIPPLDGGKLVFTWLRALDQKIGERLEMVTSAFGILALLILMIGVTVQDIVALF